MDVQQTFHTTKLANEHMFATISWEAYTPTSWRLYSMTSQTLPYQLQDRFQYISKKTSYIRCFKDMADNILHNRRGNLKIAVWFLAQLMIKRTCFKFSRQEMIRSKVRVEWTHLRSNRATGKRWSKWNRELRAMTSQINTRWETRAYSAMEMLHNSQCRELLGSKNNLRQLRICVNKSMAELISKAIWDLICQQKPTMTMVIASLLILSGTMCREYLP